MSKKVNQKGGVGKAIAAGVGVAAVSAAAYLLFGPEGKKNRKKINGWAAIQFSGIPQRPNPPNISTAPERISFTAASALSTTLLIIAEE
jgi:hypothetical protein